MFWISGGMFPWRRAGIVQPEDFVTTTAGGVACATGVEPVLPAVSGLLTVAANVAVRLCLCGCSAAARTSHHQDV